jgi:hypothetical protein
MLSWRTNGWRTILLRSSFRPYQQSSNTSTTTSTGTPAVAATSALGPGEAMLPVTGGRNYFPVYALHPPGGRGV